MTLNDRRNNASSVLGVIAVIAMLALTLSITAVVVNSSADDTSASAATSASGDTETVDVELGDLFVKPATIQVPAGSKLIAHVKNTGAMSHDLTLEGKQGTGTIDPGKTAEADFGVITQSTKAWCTIPGHKEAGMTLDIVVTGASSAAAGAAAATGPSEQPAAATIDPAATPAADWTPYDPALKPADGATEHQITLHATEKVMEVAPGVTQERWTFNDQVPGPVLRGKVGDLFTVTLVNDGKMGHSIDFHASMVAWNDEMRTIQPGESLTYQFVAKHSGVFMYHCGTAPALHHIGNGMFGAVIIDPPDLPAVDHEYLIVQSELYLAGDGQPGDLTKMQGDQWDAVVFNGYYNQYKFAPIRVEPGQRIRVWVLDAGPSENSSFHIVGTIFDTVYKEGAYLLRPDATSGGSQALDLQPAQAGFVEFTFDEAGLYPIVTHKFSNASNGALGLFQAGEVATDTAAGGH